MNSVCSGRRSRGAPPQPPPRPATATGAALTPHLSSSSLVRVGDVHDGQLGKKIDDLLLGHVGHIDLLRRFPIVTCESSLSGRAPATSARRFRARPRARQEVHEVLRARRERAHEVLRHGQQGCEQRRPQLVLAGHRRQALDALDVEHLALEVAALDDELLLVLGDLGRDLGRRRRVLVREGDGGRPLEVASTSPPSRCP